MNLELLQPFCDKTVKDLEALQTDMRELPYRPPKPLISVRQKLSTCISSATLSQDPGFLQLNTSQSRSSGTRGKGEGRRRSSRLSIPVHHTDRLFLVLRLSLLPAFLSFLIWSRVFPNSLSYLMYFGKKKICLRLNWPELGSVAHNGRDSVDADEGTLGISWLFTIQDPGHPAWV